ncbi:MAG TPA: hypothetical protein VKP30_24015 [Polyangiaceae bacterium]|nr:hypothetical protein [Polyangiaceae bacterium]
MSENEPPIDPPLENPGVRRQVARLFGESLFGAWQELELGQHVLWHENRVRYSLLRTWLLRLVSITIAVALAWGGYLLLTPGLKKSADDVRANLAVELQSFIDDGSLERAAEYITLVRKGSAADLTTGAAPALDPQDPHLDLILSAEAALYRYFDADPRRLASGKALLDRASEATPLRQLASLTTQSREERAARVRDLERLRAQFPNRNEPSYLLATALELGSNVQMARDAWVRAAQLGPAWLGHRFEQSWFEARQRDAAAARAVVGQMVRVDPVSPWTKFAVAAFAPELSILPGSSAPDAAVARATPVQTHFERLLQSIEAQKRGNEARAREELAAASLAIHDQAPFLFDAFDWLLAENLPGLARALTELPQWPREHALAASKVGRLPVAVAPGVSEKSHSAPKPARSAKSAKRSRPRKK